MCHVLLSWLLAEQKTFSGSDQTFCSFGFSPAVAGSGRPWQCFIPVKIENASKPILAQFRFFSRERKKNTPTFFTLTWLDSGRRGERPNFQPKYFLWYLSSLTKSLWYFFLRYLRKKRFFYDTRFLWYLFLPIPLFMILCRYHKKIRGIIKKKTIGLAVSSPKIPPP